MTRLFVILPVWLVLLACRPPGDSESEDVHHFPLPEAAELSLPEVLSLPEPGLPDAIRQPLEAGTRRLLDISLPDTLGAPGAGLDIPSSLAVEQLFKPASSPRLSLSVEPLLKEEKDEDGEKRTVLDGARFNLERPWP